MCLHLYLAPIAASCRTRLSSRQPPRSSLPHHHISYSVCTLAVPDRPASWPPLPLHPPAQPPKPPLCSVFDASPSPIRWGPAALIRLHTGPLWNCCAPGCSAEPLPPRRSGGNCDCRVAASVHPDAESGIFLSPRGISRGELSPSARRSRWLLHCGHCGWGVAQRIFLNGRHSYCMLHRCIWSARVGFPACPRL